MSNEAALQERDACVTCGEELPNPWLGMSRYAGSFDGVNRWRHSRCADPEQKTDADIAAERRVAAHRFEGEQSERQAVLHWLRNIASRTMTHPYLRDWIMVPGGIVDSIEKGEHRG